MYLNMYKYKYIIGIIQIKKGILSKYNPFTFISAPLFDARCNYNKMIEYVAIRKLRFFEILTVYYSGMLIYLMCFFSPAVNTGNHIG